MPAAVAAGAAHNTLHTRLAAAAVRTSAAAAGPHNRTSGAAVPALGVQEEGRNSVAGDAAQAHDDAVVRAVGAADTGKAEVGPMSGIVVNYTAAAWPGHTDRTSASVVAVARVARPMRAQCRMARMSWVPVTAEVPSEQGGAAHARAAAAAEEVEECAALDVAAGGLAEPDAAGNEWKLGVVDGALLNGGDEVRMRDESEVVDAGMRVDAVAVLAVQTAGGEYAGDGANAPVGIKAQPEARPDAKTYVPVEVPARIPHGWHTVPWIQIHPLENERDAWM